MDAIFRINDNIYLEMKLSVTFPQSECAISSIHYPLTC